MSALVGLAIGITCGFVLGVLALALIVHRENKKRADREVGW